MTDTGERGQAGERTVLVVGESEKPGAVTALPFDAGPNVIFVEIGQVGAELIESLKPEVVLSPLLARSFDCIDLARILHALDYRGAYRALSPLVPSPEVIRHEIRALCPGLSFDLIFVQNPADFTG